MDAATPAWLITLHYSADLQANRDLNWFRFYASTRAHRACPHQVLRMSARLAAGASSAPDTCCCKTVLLFT